MDENVFERWLAGVEESGAKKVASPGLHVPLTFADEAETATFLVTMTTFLWGATFFDTPSPSSPAPSASSGSEPGGSGRDGWEAAMFGALGLFLRSQGLSSEVLLAVTATDIADALDVTIYAEEQVSPGLYQQVDGPNKVHVSRILSVLHGVAREAVDEGFASPGSLIVDRMTSSAPGSLDMLATCLPSFPEELRRTLVFALHAASPCFSDVDTLDLVLNPIIAHRIASVPNLVADSDGVGIVLETVLERSSLPAWALSDVLIGRPIVGDAGE